MTTAAVGTGEVFVEHEPWWWAVVAGSVAFHAAVFALTPSTAPDRYMVKSRVMSTVHAVVVVIYFFVWVHLFGLDRMFTPSQLVSGLAGSGDEWCPPIKAFTSGYMLYDLYVMVTIKQCWDLGGIIHHLVLAPSLMLSLYGGVTNTLQFFFFIEELSTPFLNLRSLYRKQPRLYSVYSLLFFLTFYVVRLGWGNYVFYNAFFVFLEYRNVYLSTPFLKYQFYWQVTMCTISRLLNIFWGALMLRKVVQTIVGRPKTKST